MKNNIVGINWDEVNRTRKGMGLAPWPYVTEYLTKKNEKISKRKKGGDRRNDV